VNEFTAQQLLRERQRIVLFVKISEEHFYFQAIGSVTINSVPLPADEFTSTVLPWAFIMPQAKIDTKLIYFRI
jgi:hypothetical protein